MNLEFERDQLVSTWKSAFSTRWIDRPRSCVTALSSADVSKFGDHFRQVHNIFGWMAGNTLANRGLCSGAIYRSEKFMALPQAARNGSAGPKKSLIHLKNVHIEHTVPVAELNPRWAAYRAERPTDLAEAYAWMFVHSVATAVDMSEQGDLGHYESRTDAFDTRSDFYCLPFMRYAGLDTPPAIWNVMTGRRIDPKSWTFADHFGMVDMLLTECGADEDMANRIRAAAMPILENLARAVLPEAADRISAAA